MLQNQQKNLVISKYFNLLLFLVFLRWNLTEWKDHGAVDDQSLRSVNHELERAENEDTLEKENISRKMNSTTSQNTRYTVVENALQPTRYELNVKTWNYRLTLSHTIS